jgi:hypothetical protein
LGAGDNGIAFLANDGDVIKFTIDRNEAALWQRLKGQQQKGIITLKNVSNISSSQTGPTLIYVVKAEYAPYPVTDEQAELIRNAKNAATDKIREYFKTNRRTPEIYHKSRAIELVKQFEIVAASDDAFEKIPDMISDIADRFGGYIYDIEPSNFRRNNNGDVVIIDPSAPDLVGDIEQPEPLAFESKIVTALLPKIIY